jgi:hypothetical protein
VLRSVPAWERAAAASQRRAEEAPDSEGAELRAARDKLCSLLEESALYDASLVLESVAGSELWDEQVLLHCRVRTCLRWPSAMPTQDCKDIGWSCCAVPEPCPMQGLLYPGLGYTCQADSLTVRRLTADCQKDACWLACRDKLTPCPAA